MTEVALIELGGIQKEVVEPKGKRFVKFGVGMSQDWDPYKAGVQATSKALEQIGYEPKFLLIFSTIHYAKKKGGLNALLKGCRDLVDKQTPSVGGTITGFTCPEGCFTRGCVVVVGKGNIEVASAYSERVRKNPHKTGEKIARSIKEQFSTKNQNTNRILIEFISGPIEPSIMSSGLFRHNLSKLPPWITNKLNDVLTAISMKFLNYGPTTEEEILNSVDKNLTEYWFIGCSTYDDMKCIKNHQFYGNQVLNNSIVALSLSLNREVLAERKQQLIPTSKKFNIKRGWGGWSISKINNKPALDEYIKLMNWPQEYIKAHVEEVSRVAFYFPLGFRDDSEIYGFPGTFFFGENILTNRKIRSDEIELFLTSGKKNIEDTSELMSKLNDKNSIFTLVVAGMDIYGILTNNSKLMGGIVEKNVGNQPYLILYGAGEHFKKPNEKPIFDDYTIAFLSITASPITK